MHFAQSASFAVQVQSKRSATFIERFVSGRRRIFGWKASEFFFSVNEIQIKTTACTPVISGTLKKFRAADVYFHLKQTNLQTFVISAPL